MNVKIFRCGKGEPMHKVGYGKFPYECRGKDFVPDAMVYECSHGAWTYDANDLERNTRKMKKVCSSVHLRTMSKQVSTKEKRII